MLHAILQGCTNGGGVKSNKNNNNTFKMVYLFEGVKGCAHNFHTFNGIYVDRVESLFE